MRLLLLFFAIFISHSALAEKAVSQSIEIVQPVLRETPKGASVAAGYLVIRNTGTKDDRLTSANAPFAAMVETHSMKMVDGVMMMNPLPEGIVIPAGSEIRLKPGGNHLMFMKIDGVLEKSETQSVTLVFEEAGTIEVTFEVWSLAKTLSLRD